MPFRGIHKKHSDTLNSKYSFRFYRFFKEAEFNLQMQQNSD